MHTLYLLKILNLQVERGGELWKEGSLSSSWSCCWIFLLLQLTVVSKSRIRQVCSLITGYKKSPLDCNFKKGLLFRKPYKYLSDTKIHYSNHKFKARQSCQKWKWKRPFKKQESRVPYCLSLSRHVIFSLRLPSSLEVRERKGYGTENANWKMRHISTTTNAKRSRNGRRLQKVKSIFLHYATIIVLKINGLQ